MLQRVTRSLTYPIGPAEHERCAALRDLGILDTMPDKNFDAVANLASSTFEVPVALVTLLDEQRAWFKAATGWDVNEAPRDVSFCNYTIYHGDLFVVEDATRDPRFRNNPLVSGQPHIRFYAGVPIGLSDTEHLGALCIIDTKPRRLADRDAYLLRTMAQVVSNLLRQFHQTQNEQNLNHQLGSERAANIAKEIQLRDKQFLLECASELAAIGSWEYGPSTGQIEWSPETRQIFGIAREKDLTIDAVHGLFVGEHALKWRRETARFVASNTSLHFEGQIRTGNGETKWVRVLGKTESTSGRVTKFGLLQDITRERRTQQRMSEMAERDGLTGLPNRFSLLQRLRKLQRERAPFAFAMLDLDGFKSINDTFGHAAGDKCLRRIARKLTALEAHGALVARIAGDEFAIILPGECDRWALNKRAVKLVRSLSFPMCFQEQTINLTVSMGNGAKADKVLRGEL
jgi:diguanylate cyclase (GGDEF)-like protein